MKKSMLVLALGWFAAETFCAAQPALTIYNQKFAVVRDVVPLDLQRGVNEVKYSEATAHLEPSSVVLREPAGKPGLQILEQSFRADPISQGLLLSLNEGKTIRFEIRDGLSKREYISGKIVRSGYQYAANQPANIGGEEPIIEIGGELRFGLPGEPIFPALPSNTILKPTLTWLINSESAGKVNAELSYVTGGMKWEADYNLIMPEKGDTLDLAGWVTIDNQSGKSFEKAKIKLMAGDVSKIQQDQEMTFTMRYGNASGGGGGAPPVTEKTFDEYHLYTLERPTTLLDRETKQVEFVRAAGVKSAPIYVYDGLKIEPQFRGWNMQGIRDNQEYGTQSNTKVWVMREFVNSQANHLGMPLPKGRLRFYRQDTDGQMEFIGENNIEHTPKDDPRDDGRCLRSGGGTQAHEPPAGCEPSIGG